MLMREKKRKKLFQELILAVMVFLLCAGLLLCVARNYREIQMTFKALHYSIQGYPQGEVLLMGSSYMEYWKTSEADLGPLHTVNAGVGGTRVANWKDNVDRLVTPFHPRAILFYMGSNDIDGSKNSKTGEAVAQELEEFFTIVHDRLPETPIYYLSITPTPKRWPVWDETSTCNQLMSRLAEETDYLTFIDCTSAVLDENGYPKMELFRADDLHFNEKGYELWTSVIRPVMLNNLSEGGREN